MPEYASDNVLPSRWYRAVAFVALWLIVWLLAQLMEYTAHASVWFPVSGLTYAALLIIGIRAIIPLMLCAVIVTILTCIQYSLPLNPPQMIQAGLLFGLAHILPYWLSAYLFAWVARQDKLSTPGLIILYIIHTGVGSLVTTMLVIFSLIYSNMMTASEIGQAWLPFWIGDYVGVLVLAPLFGALLSRYFSHERFDLEQYLSPNQTTTSSEYPHKIIVVTLLVILTTILNQYSGQQASAFAIFLLVLPHMWIACTESALFNLLSLTYSCIIIALFVNIFGLNEFALIYQFAIVIVASNALFGIAVPALMAHNEKLQAIVTTDALTQAASRQHFMQQAERAVNRSQNDEVPLSLIMFDMDNFKKVNDTFGHSAGDKALQRVCRAAQLSLRPTDLLGRFGGDEFVALLPDSTINDAQQVAQRILSNVNAAEVAPGQPIECSFGVAQLKRNQNFTELFNVADSALYKAKQRGRNTVVNEDGVELKSAI
ncbi:diguanylate cyclase [Paraglaciecola sp. T6c]|uniref:sensor domain-containing diguanylate cyclase n=1 Tax=Pseudoalteromonas atlantica (strain T6c / ATCC BAA-1087) TaxID=3042615 RepID=UPI00005C748C|nr:diguanylate cyclase [Paraglaciecola sp. T6c]ABG42078.1 diguanylate cyclase [Paraglaciecola sp. T6c]